MGAPDSDPITITGTLIDYYEYPIEGGRLQISALGAQGIPDTCLDENGEIINIGFYEELSPGIRLISISSKEIVFERGEDSLVAINFKNQVIERNK